MTYSIGSIVYEGCVHDHKNSMSKIVVCHIHIWPCHYCHSTSISIFCLFIFSQGSIMVEGDTELKERTQQWADKVIVNLTKISLFQHTVFEIALKSMRSQVA